MKHLLKIFTIALIGFLVTSCEKDEDQAIVNELTRGTLTSDNTDLVLDKDGANSTVINFSWVKPTFNISLVPTYQLEFGIKGNNFQNSVSTDISSDATTMSFTNASLNAVMYNLKATAYVTNQIEVRLKTILGSTYFYSDVVDLIVTPYKDGPDYPYTDLYLIGDATAGGWDNLATNTKIYPLLKTTDTNAYTYTGYFAAGGFKIIKTPGSWDVQYGQASSAGSLSTDGGSGNISVASAGYYKLSIDIATLKYTFTAVADPAVNYTSISMIGTASGDWNTDVDMEQSTFDPHVWVKKNVVLNAGEFKFRANHDWTDSWGVAEEFFGTAALGGANIPVTTAYSYNVYFNDMTGNFSVIPAN
ncbi:SusE domain-containing protein [Chryseobacterium sp.]|mgnify:CR=1 FL=1|uniref:SusF/SusE family outer membrane protein n=1 Tax=Chryseobacterium sp. TaxID=1871047 RepID=UPI0025B89F5A|nr:SusE domain-containing protein [Chryseobacterium sp.]